MTTEEILAKAASRIVDGELWLPELSDPLMDRDRLDAAAERLGYPLHVGGKLDSGYTYAHGRTLADPLLQVRQIHESYRIAQQVALARAIKHVWPEVEDDD